MLLGYNSLVNTTHYSINRSGRNLKGNIIFALQPSFVNGRINSFQNSSRGRRDCSYVRSNISKQEPGPDSLYIIYSGASASSARDNNLC